MADNVRKVIEVDVKATAEAKTLLEDFKRKLESIDGSAAKAERGINGMLGTLSKLGGASIFAREVIRQVDGYRQMAMHVGETGDAMRQLEARVEGAGLRMDDLAESARRVGMSKEAFAGIASTLAPIVTEIGGARDDARALAETFGLMGKVSHSSGQAMQSALSQMQQGLAKGKIEFEDLKIMLEQAPAMSQEFAAALGVSVSELIAMSREGKLTADRVLGIADNVDTLRERAAKLPGTIKDAQTTLDDAWDGFLGKADKALGISEKIAGALKAAAEKIDRVSAPSSQTVMNAGSTATPQDIRRAMREHADALTQAREELEQATSEADRRFYQGLVNGNVDALERLQTQLDGVTQAQQAATQAEREANKATADGNKARTAAAKLADELRKAEEARAGKASSLIAALRRQAEGWGELTEAQRLAYQLTHEGLKLTEDERTRAFRAAEAIDARTEAINREKDARKALDEITREQAGRDADLAAFIEAGKTESERLQGQRDKIMDQGRAYAAMGQWDAVESAGKQLDAIGERIAKLTAADEAASLKTFSDSLGILDNVLADGKINAKDFVTVLDGIFKNPDLLKSVADLGKKILEIFSSDGFDFAGAVKGIGGFFGMSAKGNAFDSGLVSVPSAFTSGNGWGTIAEQGPEAILPLTRGADGKLGVQAQGGANLTVNVTNNVGAEVRTEMREGPNGPELAVMIDQRIKDGLARGKFDREMRGSFGISRRGR